jgi:hypothetical protein
VVVEFTGGHLVGRGHDRVPDGAVEQPVLHVVQRAALLEHAERVDYLQRHARLGAADGKVADGPLRLRAPQARFLHLERPEGVCLGPGRHGSTLKSQWSREALLGPLRASGPSDSALPPGLQLFLDARAQRCRHRRRAGVGERRVEA